MVDDVYKTQDLGPYLTTAGGERVPQLVILEGTLVGVAFPLLEDRIQIGRLPDNDLVLASKPVSKRHAAVIREADLFFVEDLGSTNGVLVNGSRIPVDSRRRLYHGDNIRLSDHLLLFRQERSLVDTQGFFRIELDHERIDSEAQEVLEDWFGATDEG